jgi:hypothetical protein
MSPQSSSLGKDLFRRRSRFRRRVLGAFFFVPLGRDLGFARVTGDEGPSVLWGCIKYEART